MNNIRRMLDRGLEIVGGTLLAMMVVVVCWQVISRYVIGAPSIWTEELLRFSLVWLSMLGMAYVCGKQEHISLTLLLNKAPEHLRAWWMLVLQLTFALFSLYILIIGGLKIASISMLQVSPVLQIPMGQVYYALPVSGLLIIIYSILNIAATVKNLRGVPHTATPSLEENHD